MSGHQHHKTAIANTVRHIHDMEHRNEPEGNLKWETGKKLHAKSDERTTSGFLNSCSINYAN